MKRILIFMALAVLVIGLFGCTGVGPATNISPIASFTIITDGLRVDFDGSKSGDSDGSIILWEWDYGDGESSVGVTAQHTYDTWGAYTITLIVTDDSGMLDQASGAVILTEPKPIPDPVGLPIAYFTYTQYPYTIQSGSKVDFDGSLSYDVHVDGYADGYINWASWDFGDGTGQAEYWTWGGVPMAMYAEHIYIAPGDYTVILIVKDNEGYVDSAVRTITIP